MKANLKIALENGRVLRVEEQESRTLLFDQQEKVGEVERWIFFDDWNSDYSHVDQVEFFLYMFNGEHVGFLGSLDGEKNSTNRIMGFFLLQDEY